MRRVQVWSVVVGLWLLLIGSALAQTGSVHIEDPDQLLGRDGGPVRQAADRLASEGADVIVVAAGSAAGNNETDAAQYLDTYLARNNIAPNSRSLQPNQIVFFVARDARYTGLWYGQRWIEALRPVGDRIQRQQMNPRFAANDISGGLVAGIDAARTTINPPTPTAVYLIGGVLAATAVGVVVMPLLRKRRAAAGALTEARERMEQARRAAGAAIADLGLLLERAQAKAEYDRISYARGDVERLQSLQRNGVQLFQEAQSAFDAAEEQQTAKATLALSDYEALTTQYNQATTLAQRASTAINEAETLRATLDAQGTPSTGPTTRLNE